LVEEAGPVLEDPDLTQEVGSEISKAANDLWLQIFEERKERKTTRTQEGYSWKEKNDLSLAFERIFEFSARANARVLALLEESPETKQRKELKQEMIRRTKEAEALRAKETA
jgi:hypothetical protein